MKLNWNYLGERGVQNKNLLWGEYGFFLELHIQHANYSPENLFTFPQSNFLCIPDDTEL